MNQAQKGALGLISSLEGELLRREREQQFGFGLGDRLINEDAIPPIAACPGSGRTGYSESQ